MLNNFIYSEEKQLFEELLNQGNVSDESIAFIEDTKEIWNRGTYFGGNINLVKEDTNQNLKTNTIELGTTLRLTSGVIDVNPDNIQIIVLSTYNNFSLRTNKLYIGSGLVLSTTATSENLPVITLKDSGVWIDHMQISSLELSPELDIYNGKQLRLKYSSDFEVNPTEGLCLAKLLSKLLLEWDNLGSIVVRSESNPELQYVLYSNGLSDLLDCSTDYEIASIGNDKFYRLSKNGIVTFNELQYFTGLTRIESGAFEYCFSLTSVTIPEGVTSIGSWAFNGCRSLTSITIPESSQLTSIGNSAFYNCRSLTAITLPEGVTSIEGYAFSGCSSLERVTINCANVGNWFRGLSSIKEIVLGASVTSIGVHAFEDCSSLTSITIPSGVTSIGEWAFSGCSSLTSIICNAATPPTIYSYTFYNVDKSIPVYVPAGSVGTYKNTSYWRNFTNIQPISE